MTYIKRRSKKSKGRLEKVQDWEKSNYFDPLGF